MDYQKILTQIKQEVQPLFGRGKVANYIPALANISPHKFGMAVRTVNGDEYMIGDATERFSIQSISKVLTLTMAIQFIGEDIWQRVGREPSGTPFNSLVQLEYEQGKPRNPLINAGALVVTDCVLSHTEDALQAILAFIIKLTGDTTIAYDAIVAQSEKKTGQRNIALANFLKSFNNMDNSVEDVLDIYFHQCSLKMSCLELARAFLFLANEGVAPATNETIVNKRQTKRINALMLTCGLYDAVGDFAYRVGLPGKSGVGGGIVAVIPKVLSVAVWSPELNTSGNSLIGTKALELFTTKTAMSIF